jgi:hypothetical protein
MAEPVGGSIIFGKAAAADSVPGPEFEKKTVNGVCCPGSFDPELPGASDEDDGDATGALEAAVPLPCAAAFPVGFIAAAFARAAANGVAGFPFAAGEAGSRPVETGSGASGMEELIAACAGLHGVATPGEAGAEGSAVVPCKFALPHELCGLSPAEFAGAEFALAKSTGPELPAARSSCVIEGAPEEAPFGSGCASLSGTDSDAGGDVIGILVSAADTVPSDASGKVSTLVAISTSAISP